MKKNDCWRRGGLTVFLFVFFLFSILTTSASLSAGECEQLTSGLFPDNPQVRRNLLLRPSALSLGAVPFDRLSLSYFRPAILRGLRAAQARVETIRNDTSPATFQNVIEALEAVDEPMANVTGVFYRLLSVQSSPALRTIAEKVGPRLVRFSSDLYQDTRIFARVKTIYDARGNLNLTVEQATLLQNTYDAFERAGALLPSASKLRAAAIKQKISSLSMRFMQNVTAAINDYELVVTDPARLSGIPEGHIKAAAAVASRLGKPGAWVFGLQREDVVTVLKYAQDRSLREQIWRANATKASSGKFDNRPIILEIVKLREENARLFGHESHAELVLRQTMAKNPETVEEFLNHLADAYRPAALRDLEDLKAFAGHEILPWDISFYSEGLRKQRFGFSDEDIRSYFSQENVLAAAFYVAHELFGMSFQERADLPVWHPSVKVFEVRDEQGQSVALFYIDAFKRNSKRPGAWMSEFQSPGEFNGKFQSAQVLNSYSLPDALGDKPVLYNLQESTTVFHEIGHALHSMNSKVRYRSLGGINVLRDFVEFPSQLNERWLLVPEVLNKFARHYETGEVIPPALANRIREAANFQAGLDGLDYVSKAMLDMAWHNVDLSDVNDVDELSHFEDWATQPYRVMDPHGKFFSASFHHIFASSYDAGYFVYRMAQSYVADAFDLFTQEGVLNRALGRRYRTHVLERGGSEEPSVLYRRFRGSDPDPEALLRSEGLLEER